MKRFIHCMKYAVLGMIVSTLVVVTSASAQEIVAEGLNNPMGLLVMPDGAVWVVDSGVGGEEAIEIIDPETGQPATGMVGMTSKVIRIAADGTQTVMAVLPSIQVTRQFLGGSRLARLGTAVYATSGAWRSEFGPEPRPYMAAIVRVDRDPPVTIASTYDFEARENPDGFIVDSHPYGIVGGADGQLYVADSGGNDVLRVNPRTGEIELVAVFEGIPSPMPNPTRGGAREADPVPTGITQASDGTLYVAGLPGVPFLPGSARIMEVTTHGDVSLLTDGLTMLTDVQIAPDGYLYAVMLAEFTPEGPVSPTSGVITRVGRDGSLEIMMENLPFPTSIAFASNGDAYVTLNGIGAPGTGRVVRYSGFGAP